MMCSCAPKFVRHVTLAVEGRDLLGPHGSTKSLRDRGRGVVSLDDDAGI